MYNGFIYVPIEKPLHRTVEYFGKIIRYFVNRKSDWNKISGGNKGLAFEFKFWTWGL